MKELMHKVDEVIDSIDYEREEEQLYNDDGELIVVNDGGHNNLNE